MQVEELRGFFPSTDHLVRSYLEYYPVERKTSLMSYSIRSPNVTCACNLEKGDSDTTLYLGYVFLTFGNTWATIRTELYYYQSIALVMLF